MSRKTEETSNQSKNNDNSEGISIWDKISPEELSSIEEFAISYLDFLTQAKTERKVNSYLLNLFKSKGFEDLAKGIQIKQGGYLSHL
ncbi:MAG: hypothetical protein LBF22_01420, partial [Deltaproteobacteria bacterium]|nr:hypothetical protein [Deltaproteobacteria bacterium]